MPTPAKLHPDELRLWATHAIVAHPGDFTAALAARFGVSRVAAAGAVRQLEQEGFVLRQRSGTRPLFAPGASRLMEQTSALPVIDESLLWSNTIRPTMGALPAHLANIAQYGFTEMVNNASDHSGGSKVSVRCALTAEALHLWIRDDGIGVFERVRSSLGLEDLRLALLELCKGKVTTDPARHSGEGLFFTSRAFTLFELRANGLLYRRRHPLDGDAALERLEDDSYVAAAGAGTEVFLSLQLDATQQLRDVFDRYTLDEPDDLSFNRTVVPVKLAAVGGENLLSRSQARRITSRIEGFRVVELDFDGVGEIGQGFADELFRVFANAHPEIELKPLNAGPGVAPMIRRVRPRAGG